MCKNNYNIDLILEFYKKDDVEQVPVTDKGFDYTLFTEGELQSQNKNNKHLKAKSVDNLKKHGLLSKIIHGPMFSFIAYFIPYSKYIISKTNHDEAWINLFEDLDNE